MGTVDKNSSYSLVGPWVCLFVFFLGCMICLLCWCMFCFTLGQLSHFFCCCFRLRNDLYCVEWGVKLYSLTHPFMLWRWRNKLKWAPSSFLLPRRCGLGAGSIPLRSIVNERQCETRGLFMLLVIHYWIGEVQDSQGVSISQNANYKYF